MRKYKDLDSENVLHFVSDILVNEFNITLDFDNLDSDLLYIQPHYNKDNSGGCFWVVERIDKHQIIGTVAIRNLKELTYTTSASSAELKRMFLAKSYRGLGIGLLCCMILIISDITYYLFCLNRYHFVIQ